MPPVTAQMILDEVNRYRDSRGLAEYVVGNVDMGIAQRWADRMAASGVLAHGGGEQIIAWSSESESSAGVVGMWRTSPGHDAWLRSAATTAGFGIAHGPRGWYYAGCFGGGLSEFGIPGGNGGESPPLAVRRPWLSWLWNWFSR